MTDVSLFRLYLLRGLYLLIGLGMGSEIWPLIIHHAKHWDLMHGVANAMLAGMTAVMLLGVRYPLKMLPMLFFELAWKTIWLVAIALPLWQAGQVDADTAETIKARLMGIIVPVVLPWRYVIANYVTAHGDRWR